MDNQQKQAILGLMGVDVYQRRQTLPEQLPAQGAGSPGLDELAADVAGCRLCSLCESRTQTVFGAGNPQARVMFVGEAPGRDEDEQGQPFVGRAGQLLTLMLAALNWKREDVYIANILKCRPPGNRNPTAGEMASCEPYLVRQIELIQPQLLVAMGRFAAQGLLASTASIASLRGQQHVYEKGKIPLVVTYHPAYLLRSPADKAKAWQDLLFINSLLG